MNKRRRKIILHRILEEIDLLTLQLYEVNEQSEDQLNPSLHDIRAQLDEKINRFRALTASQEAFR